jgi:hypothetical protein
MTLASGQRRRSFSRPRTSLLASHRRRLAPRFPLLVRSRDPSRGRTICAREKKLCPESQSLAPQPLRRSPSSCVAAAGGGHSSDTTLLLVRVFFIQKLSLFIRLRDLGRSRAEDSWFVADAGLIGVEFFESSAANGSLGLIRVLLRAIFLFAPYARVEFRNVGQQKKAVCSFILFSFS